MQKETMYGLAFQTALERGAMGADAHEHAVQTVLGASPEVARRVEILRGEYLDGKISRDVWAVRRTTAILSVEA